MKCPYNNVRFCTKCNRLLIVCEINFRKSKRGKYGFVSQCKKCDKQYYKDNREQMLEYSSQYYQEHKEEKLEYSSQYYQENKEKKLEKQSQYYQENKEKILEKQSQYYQENKEKKLEYYQEHKEEILEYHKRYNKENPHIIFNNSNKRRKKLEEQGNGITSEQWLEMMKFFDFCCAYSGEYLGGEENKYIRTIDHIIALDNGGLNEIWNCVPMYRTYNSSKHTQDIEQWYRQQDFFSEERLAKIYEWIEYAYSKWKSN